MELRHLRYFVAVAECQSVRQASEQLHITQPAISRQIQDLEQELGFPLFVRSPRGLTLTPAGQSYLRDVRAVIVTLERAARRAQELAQGARGIIRLGYVENAGWDGILPHTVSRFRAECPDVTIELLALNSLEQLRAIAAGTIDGGFIYQYGDLPDNLATLPLIEYNVTLAVPRAWGLLQRENPSIEIAAMAGRPFVMFPRQVYPAYYDQLIEACQRRGVSLNVVHEASTEATILAMVCSGIGAAIVNSANIGRPPAQVQFFSLRDVSIPMPLIFASPRDRQENPALARFISTLKVVLAT